MTTIKAACLIGFFFSTLSALIMVKLLPAWGLLAMWLCFTATFIALAYIVLRYMP